MHFKEDVVVNKFSHIYIEEEMKDNAMTKSHRFFRMLQKLSFMIIVMYLIAGNSHMHIRNLHRI